MVPCPSDPILLNLFFSKTSEHGEHVINSSNIKTKNFTQEDMIKENGRVGTLFASKAFVQLVANPLVGYATTKRGYHLPFICGTSILLLSSLSKYFVWCWCWFVAHRCNIKKETNILFMNLLVLWSILNKLRNDQYPMLFRSPESNFHYLCIVVPWPNAIWKFGDAHRQT